MVTLPYNWAPRDYQLPAWRALEAGAQRVLLVWHRRAGKDNLGLNWTVRSSMQRVGMYWHVFPTYNQGRKALWNGATKEGRRFLDFWPKQLIKRGPVEDEMLIELVNGSIWQVVGTDNIDRLVGANPVGVVMSEYPLQDPRAWDLLRPILSENEGWAIFPYTPRGRNHGYELYQNAVEKLVPKWPGRWFVQKLSVDDTWKHDEEGRKVPVITQEIIEEDRLSGMAPELIDQEYYVSFDAPLIGSYYGDAMKEAEAQGRIGEVPWDPRLPVDTWWDIGTRDSTSIWFAQVQGMKVNIIDYYEASGKGIEHYKKILDERPYAYGRHIGPHDLKKTEFGTGKKIIEQATTLGIRFTVAKKLLVQEGVTAVRSLLFRCYFNRATCDRGIRALKEYRKEWDEDRKCFGDHPVHDWTSHGADAFRYGAVGMRERSSTPIQTHADSNFNPLAPDSQRVRQPLTYSDYNPFGE